MGILENNRVAKSFFCNDPFRNTDPPKYVRSLLYDYRFPNDFDEKDQNYQVGKYWARKKLGTFCILQLENEKINLKN